MPLKLRKSMKIYETMFVVILSNRTNEYAPEPTFSKFRFELRYLNSINFPPML